MNAGLNDMMSQAQSRVKRESPYKEPPVVKGSPQRVVRNQSPVRPKASNFRNQSRGRDVSPGGLNERHKGQPTI